MTTKSKMECPYAAQREVINTLREIGDPDLADCLQRCMTARQQRHYGDGWPYSCRSAACFWCRRAMIRGWWSGIRYWSESAATSSLAIIPVLSPAGLPDAARRLRRGLRDVETERPDAGRQWRTVAFAGLMGGNHIAMVMVSYQGIDRREVLDVIHRRWPDVALKDLEAEEPVWELTPYQAADLGSRHRGAEPLRMVVMPQRVQRTVVAPAPEIEPMPVVI